MWEAVSIRCQRSSARSPVKQPNYPEGRGGPSTGARGEESPAGRPAGMAWQPPAATVRRPRKRSAPRSLVPETADPVLSLGGPLPLLRCAPIVLNTPDSPGASGANGCPPLRRPCSPLSSRKEQTRSSSPFRATVFLCVRSFLRKRRMRTTLVCDARARTPARFPARLRVYAKRAQRRRKSVLACGWRQPSSEAIWTTVVYAKNEVS